MQLETTGFKMGMNLDMPNDVYHSGTPGVSKSMLDKIAEGCPLKFWAAYIDPEREPEKKTDALILGDAIHTAALQPDIFGKQYLIMPDFNLRSPKGREARDKWLEEEAAGKQVLTIKQRDHALQVAAALRRHPKASQLMGSNYTPEVSFFSRCRRTGVLKKCRTDLFDLNNGIVVDLKTTDDVSPTAFAKSVINFRYLVQEGWYRDVLDEANGQEPELWIWLVVEKEYPHPVGIYQLDADDVEMGRQLGRRDLDRIIECQKTNLWPDYGDSGIQTITLPGWARSSLGFTQEMF